jgi:FkbM family methyltransferase
VSLKAVARHTARRLGVEDQARRLRRALQPRHSRRNWEDDQQLRRLILLGLSSDSDCVDIGANVGTILAWITEAAPRGRHIAFEPVPALRQRLAQRFPDVDVRGEAVSDRTGTARFTVVRDVPSRSGLEPLNVPQRAVTETVAVRTVRLDDALPAGYRPRLIKIDVEGTELDVLRGARSVLAAHDVLVAFEHGHGANQPDPARSAELYDVLRECGLRVFDMRGREFDEPAFREVYRTGAGWNFLARR